MRKRSLAALLAFSLIFSTVLPAAATDTAESTGDVAAEAQEVQVSDPAADTDAALAEIPTEYAADELTVGEDGSDLADDTIVDEEISDEAAAEEQAADIAAEPQLVIEDSEVVDTPALVSDVQYYYRPDQGVADQTLVGTSASLPTSMEVYTSSRFENDTMVAEIPITSYSIIKQEVWNEDSASWTDAPDGYVVGHIVTENGDFAAENVGRATIRMTYKLYDSEETGFLDAVIRAENEEYYMMVRRERGGYQLLPGEPINYTISLIKYYYDEDDRGIEEVIPTSEYQPEATFRSYEGKDMTDSVEMSWRSIEDGMVWQLTLKASEAIGDIYGDIIISGKTSADILGEIYECIDYEEDGYYSIGYKKPANIGVGETFDCKNLELKLLYHYLDGSEPKIREVPVDNEEFSLEIDTDMWNDDNWKDTTPEAPITSKVLERISRDEITIPVQVLREGYGRICWEDIRFASLYDDSDEDDPSEEDPGEEDESPCADGHTWDNGTITTPATVFADAVKTYKCSYCGETKQEAVPGTKLKPTVTLTATSLTMKKKQSTKKLVASGLALGDSLASAVSSNTKVVKVTSVNAQTGEIGLKAQNKTGKASLTIKLASGHTVTVSVKVQSAAVKTTKISGVPKKLTLKTKKTYTLKPVLKPITTQDKLKFTTSNKKVATVSKKGVIKAKKKGSVTITVTCGKKKVKCKVKVTN